MYSSVTPFAGNQPFNDWFVADTTQRNQLGIELTGVDPFWGTGVFLYLKSNDAILKGSVVMWDETYQAALLPSTVTQGFPFAVAMAPAASGTYFWAIHSGRAVYKTNATVAADGVLAVAAAGILGATATGKQVLGIRNRISATGTLALNANLTNSQAKIVTVKGYDGWFLGMALSGTGVPASTIVAGLDPDGRSVYMGSAIGTIDKTATVTGLQSVTGTYTGFGSGMLNRPSCMQIVT